MWFSWRLKSTGIRATSAAPAGRGRPPASDQAAGIFAGQKRGEARGFDYWKQVNLTVWNSFDEMIDAQRPNEDEMAVFTKTRCPALLDHAGGRRDCFWSSARRPADFPNLF